jgi:hypothetical protein
LKSLHSILPVTVIDCVEVIPRFTFKSASILTDCADNEISPEEAISISPSTAIVVVPNTVCVTSQILSVLHYHQLA